MIKLGFISDEASQDFETAAKLAKQYGLHGLEIRSVYNKGPHELTREDISRITAIQDEYGLEIPAVSSPFYKCEINEPREAQLSVLANCIVLAKAVGARLIRGFTFWDRGGFNEKLPDIVRAFDEPIRMLEAANMTMVLEHEPSVYASTAARLKTILDAIASPRVQALFDPGNGLFNDPPEDTVESAKILAPYLRHVHLKDARKIAVRNVGNDALIVPPPIEAVCLGTGGADYPRLLPCLADSGYNGWMMLETHYRKQATISKELLALPKGDAFSHMGYEATEESLLAWEQLRKN